MIPIPAGIGHHSSDSVNEYVNSKIRIVKCNDSIQNVTDFVMIFAKRGLRVTPATPTP